MTPQEGKVSGWSIAGAPLINLYSKQTLSD